MEFRIGIHTGDVIQDGSRIYGEDVNVAARIESLADPGGICISRTAYDQVNKKLNYGYEYLGDYEVKNIDYGMTKDIGIKLKHKLVNTRKLNFYGRELIFIGGL